MQCTIRQRRHLLAYERRSKILGGRNRVSIFGVGEVFIFLSYGQPYLVPSALFLYHVLNIIGLPQHRSKFTESVLGRDCFLHPVWGVYASKEVHKYKLVLHKFIQR